MTRNRYLPNLLLSPFIFSGAFISRIFILFFYIFQSFSLTSCDTGSSIVSDTKLSIDFQSKRLPAEFYKLKFVDLEGRKRSLSEFRGKNLLINLWATWCAPCVSELPSMQRAYDKLRDLDIEIIAVSSEKRENYTKVKDLVKKLNLQFTVFMDSDLKLAESLQVTGFPESFLISKDGNLLELYDNQTGKFETRIISDRVWDSPEVLESLETAIK